MLRSMRWVCAVIVALVAACGSDPELLTLTVSGDARADGQSGITITAKVMKGTTPINRGSLTFGSNMVGSSFSPITDLTTVPTVTDRTGYKGALPDSPFAVLYSATAGSATVTVNYLDDVSLKTDTATANVTFTNGGTKSNISSFDFVGADPSRVPLTGSSKVTFQAKDSQGKPVSGLDVTFSVSPAGTVLFDPATAATNSEGMVSTTVTGKGIAGTVAVTVLATADNGTKVSKTSTNIAISGGGINAGNLSLTCPHYSIGGLSEFGLTMECQVFGSDYNHAFVPDSEVIFLSEAGGVPRSVPFSQGNDGGVAVFTYRTQCKLPRDVTPLGTADDKGYNCMFTDPCEAQPKPKARVCNPRDGVAMLVAITTGSEAFQDSNGNGKWDPGETFTDLPEPYVDANDNGTHDANEDFYDANQNGKWDDKNGKYDDNTAIWTSIPILWTGGPDVASSGVDVLPDNQSGSDPDAAHCSRKIYTATLHDINGNPPSSAAVDDVMAAECTGNCSVFKVSAYSDGNGWPYANKTPKPGTVKVTIDDGHSCPGPCDPPDCGPAPYTLSLSLTRTLDGSASVSVVDSLDPLMTPTEGPRAGIYQ